MTTKLVNGQRAEMTAQEVSTFEASRVMTNAEIKINLETEIRFEAYQAAMARLVAKDPEVATVRDEKMAEIQAAKTRAEIDAVDVKNGWPA